MSWDFLLVDGNILPHRGGRAGEKPDSKPMGNLATLQQPDSKAEACGHLAGGAAAFVATTPYEGPQQTHLAWGLRQGRETKQQVRLGDRFSWPTHFTSRARHGGARLEQFSEMVVLFEFEFEFEFEFADRFYVSTFYTFFSPPGAVSASFGEHAID